MRVFTGKSEDESMKTFYVNRLLQSLEDAAKEAEEKGLSGEELQELLADES